MLKVAVNLESMPAAMSAQATSGRDKRAWRRWEEDGEQGPFEPLTRTEVEELRRRQPSVSPWQVIGAQALLGLLLAAAAWLLFGRAVAASALYGAGVAVLPGALMARGSTSPLARLTPVAGALSILLWSFVKIGATVMLLALAPRVVQPLHWPALLVALVACLQVYWFALLVRGRPK
ncbi:MAG TPA: ATP synthase subunit I, partial [Caldimonas sp.]|nr:ATP synthase subunit I [Caldimonas sp.]